MAAGWVLGHVSCGVSCMLQVLDVCVGPPVFLPMLLCVLVVGHLLVLHWVNSTGEAGGGAGMVLGRSDRVNF